MTEAVPRLLHTDLGDTVSYKGRFLYSRRDPVKNPRHMAGKAVVQPETLILVPSPLLFYGVRRLLKTLPEKCHILCVETDQQLMRFSLEHAPADLLHCDTITVVRTDVPTALIRQIDQLDIGRFRRIMLLPLSGGYQLNREAYDVLAAAAERHIQRYWQNRITLIHMGRLWIRNIIANLSRHWPSFVSAFPVSEKPVVVAGAGESLESAFEILKKERNRVFLLAVDTALPVLTSSGIVPDLVVMLEGQLVNSGDFIGHGYRCIPLLCDLSAHPSTLGGMTGDKHFVLSLFSQNSFLDRLKKSGLSIPGLRPMGSVGVVAVEIARMISAAPLILTGLDFCYTPGKPHARGALSHMLSLATSCRTRPVGWYANSMRFPLMRVKSNSGKDITTDLMLYSYGSDLNEFLKANAPAYDLKRDGIKLDTKSFYCDRQFSDFLDGWETNAKPRNRGETPVEAGEEGEVKRIIRNFLENENALLESFLYRYHTAKKGGRNAPADDALQSALHKIDYVYLDFPDAGISPELTPNFLVRAAASAADFQRSICKALSLLS